jgi:hypothetical protein
MQQRAGRASGSTGVLKPEWLTNKAKHHRSRQSQESKAADLDRSWVYTCVEELGRVKADSRDVRIGCSEGYIYLLQAATAFSAMSVQHDVKLLAIADKVPKGEVTLLRGTRRSQVRTNPGQV